MRIRIFMLLVAFVASLTTVLAQSNVTTEQLSDNVSAYWAEQQHSATMTQVSNLSPDDALPSVRFANSLELGTAVPGASLILLMELYTDVDRGLQSQSRNFSQILHDASHYSSAERCWPCLSLNYQHSVKRWLSLGVKSTVGWKTRSERHVVSNDVYRRYSMCLASLMFNMRFSWLHRDYVSMYSSLGLGAMAHIQFGDSWLAPMVDAAWVGISVGKRVYGYAEFGAGVGGVLRAGVGVRF
ncbi:MAG: hypothetical protein IJE99_00250 [Alistipes sp.]|nr:hypothetical protein [Alistipes sp.]